MLKPSSLRRSSEPQAKAKRSPREMPAQLGRNWRDAMPKGRSTLEMALAEPEAKRLFPGA